MSNMANTNRALSMRHTSYMHAVSFEAILDYLDWFPDYETPQPLAVADDTQYWTEFYENVVPEKYLAEFGGVLTALLDSFLEYHEANGRLSSEERLEQFCIYQAEILRALVRYDMRVDAMSFRPLTLNADEKARLTKYLLLYADTDNARADWDRFSEKVSGLMGATQMFPHDSHRKLGHIAINLRLKMMEIPYRIAWFDDVFQVVPVEEEHSDV